MNVPQKLVTMDEFDELTKFVYRFVSGMVNSTDEQVRITSMRVKKEMEIKFKCGSTNKRN